MKYLGIDFGTKHIGLATSDSGGCVAMPKAVVPNTAQGHEDIVHVIKQENIQALVIGKSVDLRGEPNAVQQNIDSFSRWVGNETGLPVHVMNELMSSRQAKWGTEHMIRFNPRNSDRRTLHKKQQRIDDKAAAIILQSFLDSNSV